MANEISFDGACVLLEKLLRGDARREILTGFSKAKNSVAALRLLRDAMRSGMFRVRAETFQLDPIVQTFDSQVPGVGFHVLHDWDGKADKLLEEIIPVDVVHYFIGLPPQDYSADAALAILLDYYFMYLLALLAMGAWREGSPNDNLDRVSGLLLNLQSSDGSGHQFVRDAETLILISTSHFEPDEGAYRQLLANVGTLDSPHRVRIALTHAAILGSHLRHGFQDLYKRDVLIMRDDNGPDYPWLFFAVSTLLKEYARLHDEGLYGTERDKVVEGIINGLTPDARALIGKAPPSLAGYEIEHAEFRALFDKYRGALLEEFEKHRPSEQIYSPLSFNFNFPHNAVKGFVASAISRGGVAPLPVNDLLTGIPRTPELEQGRKILVKELTDQARTSPDIIRGRPVPIFSYDPYRGIRKFVKAIGVIRELGQ
jgi:hypothetical protein